MATSTNWKQIGEITAKILNHPVGQQITIRLANDLITYVERYIEEQMRNRSTLPTAVQNGHQYMLRAISSDAVQQRNTNLISAQNAYKSLIRREDSYNEFYANFWTGITAIQLGNTDTAKSYFKAAYHCGATLLIDGQNQSYYGAEYDTRYNIAYILDVMGPSLGIADPSKYYRGT